MLTPTAPAAQPAAAGTPAPRRWILATCSTRRSSACCCRWSCCVPAAPAGNSLRPPTTRGRSKGVIETPVACSRCLQPCTRSPVYTPDPCSVPSRACRTLPPPPLASPLPPRCRRHRLCIVAATAEAATTTNHRRVCDSWAWMGAATVAAAMAWARVTTRAGRRRRRGRRRHGRRGHGRRHHGRQRHGRRPHRRGGVGVGEHETASANFLAIRVAVRCLIFRIRSLFLLRRFRLDSLKGAPPAARSALARLP